MEEEREPEIPAGRRHIIERPRLTRLLDDTAARVIMLVAPAGYGKTTLARQWLARRPHFWYVATSASSDVAALALGLVEAAERVVPGIGRQLRGWLSSTAEPEQEVRLIAELLSAAFSSWPTDAWFGIDDYHLLSSDASQDLVGLLLGQKPLQLLLTSRYRPKWTTARHLLYGEFYEITQDSLAMNPEEASAVLAGREPQSTQTLLAVAGGWPAVIGLAALAASPPMLETENDLPETLHDYFAAEIYSSLTSANQKAVCQLALAPITDRKTASTILGSSADSVINQASQVGLLIPRDDVTFELHPLLRLFLLRRLKSWDASELSKVVTRAVRVLIQSSSWDDAFALVKRFSRSDLLDELLSASIADLARDGRLSTLRQWLDYGRSENFTSPYLDLADAELSFRQGMYDRAELLAVRAAQALGHSSSLTSAALCRAGQSRYFTDDGRAALGHFRSAKQAAVTNLDARNALWGQLVVSLELERGGAAKLLREFQSVGRPTPDSAVRVLNGKLMLAIRTGGVQEAITEVESMKSIIVEATDPIVRSSFWHIYSAALVLAADYEAALNAAAQALEEVRRFHVEFARPHAYIDQAAANIGLRQFREASDVLDEVERLADERNDIYLAMNARTLRCRLLLNEGAAEEAWRVTGGTWPRSPSPSQQAEFVATRAAASVSAGRPEEALELVGNAEQLSGQLEPRLLAQWVRVLISLHVNQQTPTRLVREAFNETIASGALDVLVFAYRQNDNILISLAQDRSTHDQLNELLARANDSHSASRLGFKQLSKSRVRQPQQTLTNRESEVYALLAEGRTNGEIARALFITEVTVKVHVRHILQKLGVRTRTEAAVLSNTPRLSRAAPE